MKWLLFFILTSILLGACTDNASVTQQSALERTPDGVHVHAQSSLVEIAEDQEQALDGVRDQAQRIVWAAKDNGDDINWHSAVEYCAGLGTGWRLPTVSQLMVLFTKHEPVKSKINLTGQWYWSLDEFESVHREEGDPFTGSAMVEEDHRALCVHREPNPKALEHSGLERIFDGVYDHTLNVIWDTSDNDKSIDWNAAIEFCRMLGEGRTLPTVAQLQALSARHEAAEELIELTGDWYWSSEKNASRAAWSAWAVWLESGEPASNFLDTDYRGRALCVRRP
ncbi:MAG: DUF1566 domain-containing protein [Zoogloeaceae bacterium]|nr:DUF1566 domain-containing protein [Zoogloeaceae bacterium]